MKNIIPPLIAVILMAFICGCQIKEDNLTASNKKQIQTAFDNWKKGKGTVFDLLDENVTWVVAGSSPVSGTYRSKKELLDVVRQINAKLSGPIVPEVKQIIAQDDVVVAVWQGKAPAKDGNVYSNTYSWVLTLKEGKIIRVTAFLDTYLLSQLLGQ
ncbi:nuclear transport factor 2 family protein [Mucilaginibacter sp. UR6-1]|uniref:nuclear transport factor 2 family protein n=1 Tax=Mucilaginibacter sp. UR6-1 TaxID=1435643 RepID=UPI001E43FC5C|nr:nuclear transport factor 2 family protein [Mucilaginibacter sp. UR6-1]MCC8409149.1 nuclear transport factor 2 family protein [Mucilaginibacter sp. UR6-1]